MTHNRRKPQARRAFLQRAGLQAAGLVTLVTAAARAQDKLAPEMVMYQDQPKDGQKCSTCLHFQAPNACAIVSGNISPEGWCAVWAAKG
ncbi:high-potential iron-sulfur protein [Belnapia rosea]|uniref:High-potential iron-sulfur protein n=1 Tax=Belnapia rosea TaxID=938405 RepID=A0A1G6YEV2_9PROT|nr:high-potential iron-sulfur protein [Belnapia rosea]SDB70992.1 High potential iron-sulfur protein [Belnapia rosea]SDD88852.1 High potential iron-sulfur protein [Belnapia rosea]